MEITKSHRDIHVASEAVGLFVVAPLLAYLASQDRALSRAERRMLVAVALGTAIVDGYLLNRYVGR